MLIRKGYRLEFIGVIANSVVVAAVDALLGSSWWTRCQ